MNETCELCEAARLTEWFFEDETCWIAECEQCYVPMVVWKHHDAEPPAAVRDTMLQVLGDVVHASYCFDGFYIDDNMRSIPNHYHAHARPRGGFFGHGLRRTSP
ncbi:MAG: hypothetical protein ACXWBO_06505 [Ilumatobacteraceae bacterium]